MHFSVLCSGSRGNALYVESGKTGILIDAGFSGKEMQKRMKSIDRDLANINALCITHEHHDHISGAGVISRRFKIPAHANPGTLAAGEKRLGKLFSRKEFETGDILEIRDLQVRSFRISHDTADPVGYVISNGVHSVGYCTDTGKVSHLMATRLVKCDVVVLEFNHDLDMLRNGPYPLPLQQRVRSSRGHLSNDDAADFLSQLVCGKVRVAVLAHMSEKNNTPELAKGAAIRSLKDSADTAVLTATQSKAMPMIDLAEFY
jgi:phosphoribosyl 1,2-cyclic phosphodiesterase